MPTTDYSSSKRLVADIQKRLDQAVSEIRANRSLTEAGRKREIAKSVLEARKQAASAKSSFAAQRDSQRDGMRRIAFGSTTFDPSPADQISVRDAADRAAKLDKEDDAKSVLAQAILHNDEQLAKAVAARAYDRGWGDVVGKYGQTFDKQVFIDRLDEIPSGPRTDTADGLIFRVRPPQELNGYVSDHDLQTLVNQEVH